MATSNLKSQLPILIALGSIWGLMETGMGAYLKGVCAYMTTGSIMTAVALGFFATSFAYSRKIWSLAFVFIIAALFKSIDAYLLHIPIMSGAIANPIFGFFTEGLAFLFIFAILSGSLKSKRYGQSIWGGTAALVAINLFPLVKFATGIPACVYPNTQYPTALYFAPIAIGLSLLTCPIGIIVGEKLSALETKTAPQFIHFPANSAAVLSLLALITMRLVVK
ncbi:MAG: hypothetical protein ACE14V_08020 [bacterium]